MTKLSRWVTIEQAAKILGCEPVEVINSYGSALSRARCFSDRPTMVLRSEVEKAPRRARRVTELRVQIAALAGRVAAMREAAPR